MSVMKKKLIKNEDGIVEIDALDISMIHGDYGAVAAKPVIYLYPETVNSTVLL